MIYIIASLLFIILILLCFIFLNGNLPSANMASWFSGLATFSVGLISLFQAFYKPKPKIEVKIASVEGNSINISYKAVYKAIISIQNKSVVTQDFIVLKIKGWSISYKDPFENALDGDHGLNSFVLAPDGEGAKTKYSIKIYKHILPNYENSIGEIPILEAIKFFFKPFDATSLSKISPASFRTTFTLSPPFKFSL